MQIQFLNWRGARHLGRVVNLDNPTGSNQPLDLRWNCNNIVLGLPAYKNLGLVEEKLGHRVIRNYLRFLHAHIRFCSAFDERLDLYCFN